jgi:aryl-alcohol dehydrogenase-like predicted oxidoreductase
MINRAIEKDLIPYSISKNISTIAYSPLQRGLLTGKISSNYTFKENDHRNNNKFFKHENREIILKFLEELKPIAESYNSTISQLVVNWTLKQPGITIALVGARTKEQAKENAHACNFKIKDEDLKFINEQLNDLKIDLT